MPALATTEQIWNSSLMPTAIAHVPTAQGAKYIQQLLKHWAHKLPVELDGDRGTVRFPDAAAVMAATGAELTVSLEADTPETLERMKDVLARHLDRFAFREAPLPFEWQAA
jgi:hypothetical protein